ncbi:MAG: ATP-binding protein [Rhodothermales bacterium]|nr:ATP-binding protein [Rhodothermales bacterium]MBO6781583.1 ATP-binding protein [Rhodothermales bacterium]
MISESPQEKSLSLSDVQRLAGIGEGQFIEFKRRVPQGRRLAKEVVAFANSSGGHLLLGVNDAGEVVGLRDVHEEIFALERALEQHCYPAVAYSLERVEVSRRREVIVVRVPESEGKPHFVIEPDDPMRRTAYVRVKDMSIEASREAVRLMRTGTDSDTSFEFGKKELLLMRYLDEYQRITVSQFAQLADIPNKRASHTLVLLARAEVLKLHIDAGGDYFTLARNRAA